MFFDRAVYGRNVRDRFDHYQSVFPRENGADDKHFACFQWTRRRNAADRHGESLDRFPIQTAFWLLTVLGVIMLFLVLVLQILESTKSRILKKSENSGVKSI